MPQTRFDDDFVPDVVFHGAGEFRGVFEGMWYAYPDLTLEVLRGAFFADNPSHCRCPRAADGNTG
jgi:hypothetical protein